MTAPGADLDTSLRDHYARLRSPPDWHPAAEELVRYHEDRLPEAAGEKIRDHLVACEECSALLLELEEWTTQPPVAPGDATFEAAAAWRRQRSLLGSSRPSSPPAGQRLRLLAATLAAVALGLGYALVSARDALSKLRAPQTDVAIVNLEPVGSVRDGARPVDAKLNPEAPRWILILHLADGSEHPSYELEFRAPSGRLLSTLEGLSRHADGSFRLSLPRDYLPPGTYGLRLLGEGEPLEDYVLTLEER